MTAAELLIMYDFVQNIDMIPLSCTLNRHYRKEVTMSQGLIIAAFVLFVIEAGWHRSLLAAGLACLVLGAWLL